MALYAYDRRFESSFPLDMVGAVSFKYPPPDEFGFACLKHLLNGCVSPTRYVSRLPVRLPEQTGIRT